MEKKYWNFEPLPNGDLDPRDYAVAKIKSIRAREGPNTCWGEDVCLPFLLHGASSLFMQCAGVG